MPLQISRNDIRNVYADAIVDPTDGFYSGSTGTDYQIHQAAGKGLDEYCAKLPELQVGEAVVTDSFELNNCRYIIHTHGPHYIDGTHDEEKKLASCYLNCLLIAKESGLESIAFPLISSGNYSFPRGRALKVARDVIIDFLKDNEMDVTLLIYDRDCFDRTSRIYLSVSSYLERRLMPHQNMAGAAKQSRSEKTSLFGRPRKEKVSSVKSDFFPEMEDADYSFSSASYRFEPDESFSEAMIRMIDEKGLKDPEVYKKANIDRKHFNHIKNTKLYKPKKETAVALAIGMKLNLKETNDLLEKAGYVLSRSSVSDLIIRHCIEEGIYNIFDINELLFQYDQKTLGC